MRECFCLFPFMLHFAEGCHLSGNGGTQEVTGFTGGSVLLPCSCTHPQSTVKFTWLKLDRVGGKRNEVFQNESYNGRLKLFNENSPANLSLLISDLRKEDEGSYRCESSYYTDIGVKIKEEKTTKKTEDKKFFFLLLLLPVLILLAVLALIYWKYRGRDAKKMTNDGLELVRSENEKQADVNPDSLTQGQNLKPDENEDEVTYTSVVHVKKTAHKQTVMAEHSEYASIK